MKYLKVKTKGNSNPKGKPRAYFTCHPDDYDKALEKVCSDIFKTHDCAIYYTENMADEYADVNWETDLNQMNLFVIPVTFRLLSTPNRTMSIDLRFAKENHIPVLPIMLEKGIDEIYSKEENFGELQYLNPYDYDLTAISYEEKLKKYLDSVLISDELAKKIRAAFDAYIFLSYRKKDRKHANELMQIIHSNPLCQNIAIWYDEFLTPGESFKENISKILENSKLFALLVTPSLLEEPDGKPNFVMGNEYPEAKKSGIEILPAEMIKTDSDSLKEKYNNIPDSYRFDSEEDKNRFIETISKLTHEGSENNPEHNYFLGLAYLDGIDVEVDREKAINFIIDAAEMNYVDAMNKLVSLYCKGEAVSVDYNKAIIWKKKIVEINRKDGVLPTLAQSLVDLAILLQDCNNYDEAEKTYLESINLLEKLEDWFEQENLMCNDLAVACYNLSRLYNKNGSTEISKKYLTKAIEKYKRSIHAFQDIQDGENNNPVYQSSIDAIALFNSQMVSGLLTCYYLLAIINYEEEDFQNAEELLLKIESQLNLISNSTEYLLLKTNTLNLLTIIYEKQNKHLEEDLLFEKFNDTVSKLETESKELVQQRAMLYCRIGQYQNNNCRYREASKNLTNAIKLYEELSEYNFNEYAEDLAKSYNNYAISLFYLSNSLSFDFFKKAYLIYKKLSDINPQRYSDLLETLCINIATLYFNTAIRDSKYELLNEASTYVLESLAVHKSINTLRNINKEMTQNLCSLCYNMGLTYMNDALFAPDNSLLYYKEALWLAKQCAEGSDFIAPYDNLNRVLYRLILHPLTKKDEKKEYCCLLGFNAAQLFKVTDKREYYDLLQFVENELSKLE